MVARQLGHTNPSFTQDMYGHLFEQARHAAELRDRLEEGFGHLLDVNTDVNQTVEPDETAAEENAEIIALNGY